MSLIINRKDGERILVLSKTGKVLGSITCKGNNVTLRFDLSDEIRIEREERVYVEKEKAHD